MHKTFNLLCFFLVSVNCFGQATFDRVYSILQSKCATTCHNSSNLTGNLDLSGSKTAVLNALLNVNPDNATALAEGLKRVYPGDARKSFLFKKINQGLDVNLTLKSGEGVAEPQEQYPLTETEREMIRQWIIFGASSSTNYTWVRENVIDDFYNGKAEARTAPLALPGSDGFQIYFGPIFLKPGEEVEFANKFPLGNTEDLEVYRMHTVVNKESHHMALWKYKPGLDILSQYGLQKLNGITDEAVLFFAAEVVGQWPDPLEIELPAGTALIWNANTFINLGYHILNYSDSIIAAEIYMNVYARPRQPGTIPMLSYPVRYDGKDPYDGGTNVNALQIWPGSDSLFTINQYSPDSSMWYVWSLQAHTHRTGTNFNVWQRNEDGTKGDIIYNGQYNAAYTFPQGYYDWEHPPFRYFDPLLPVDMKKGLIHQAEFHNNTADTINFGLKTTDEMFVTYMYYTKSLPPSTGIINERLAVNKSLRIIPNPVQQEALILINPNIILKDAQLWLYDLLGKEVLAANGIACNQLILDLNELSNGSYFYRLINDGKAVASGKFVVQR